MHPITKLRIAKGFTKASFSHEIDVSWTTVESWEKGTYFPNPRKIPKLAAVLGVEPRELVEMIEQWQKEEAKSA